MTSEIITALREYASTYDRILAVFGLALILLGILGGVDGKLKILLSFRRQVAAVSIGILIISIPIAPIFFRQVSLQELKDLKKKIDESRMELSRLPDPNGGDHGHYLDNNLIEAQRWIDVLIAKKEGIF